MRSWITSISVAMVLAFASAGQAATTAAGLAGTWVAQSGTVRSTTTSTSSLLLPSGLVRTYFLSGSIKYSESADASSLSVSTSTNLSSPTGLFLSNPTVIRLTSGTFLAVYELSTANSTTGNRLLYAATSSDGVTFGTGTQLPNSSLDTALGGSTIFQSVPCLVQEPGGNVRVYYVANGFSVASMTSTDSGATWTQDSGYRFTGTNDGTNSVSYVDPEVKILSDGSRAMFLSYQTQTRTTGGSGPIVTAVLRLATSSDGTTFTMIPVDILSSTGDLLLDPDVVQLANGTWVMLYGAGANSQSIDLKRAVIDPTATITPATGWWWNASEAGRGFSIEVSGDNLFMGGFLYAGDGSCIWYVASGERGGSIFFNSLQQFGSGQTLSGSYRAPSFVGSVGNVTLNFTSTTTGTMVWPGGTVAIERFPIDGQAVVAAATGMPTTGWWWNASESGSGYFLEVQGQNLFMAAYMYADSNQAAWYTASGAMVSTSLYQGSLVEYGNGQTLTGTYQAPSLAANRGTISISFASTTAATLTLPSGRTVALTRYTF